jgi:hypothetical protein
MTVHKPDFAEFRALLDRLALILGPGDWKDPQTKTKLDKPPDDVVEAYWSALRDLPLEMFRRCVESHLKRGKWFPRPFQLRPKDDAGDRLALSASAARSSHLAMMESARLEPGRCGHLPGVFEVNRGNWCEFKAADPELASIEYLISQWGRLLAAERLDSPQYAEAMREDRRLRDARRDLVEQRRA